MSGRNRWGSHPVTNGTTRTAQLVRERGLTRPQIMAATGISDRTLTRMFTGNHTGTFKVDRHYYIKMADLLNVHPNELLPGPQ